MRNDAVLVTDATAAAAAASAAATTISDHCLPLPCLPSLLAAVTTLITEH